MTPLRNRTGIITSAMKKPTAITPSFTHALEDTLGAAGQIVAFDAGPRADAYIVVALKPLDYRTAAAKNQASFVKTVPEAAQRYRVVGVRAGEVELDVCIEDEKFNVHHVQPLGDELVLACARSYYRGPNDFDRNGRIYRRNGEFLREILLGDGVQTMQATSHGELWTSYFDEGIFGNYGWRDPVGASGLLAWSETGEKLYTYQPEGTLDSMADCYALNVAGNEDVWAYYYTDFPLVHLRKKRIAAFWAVPVTGSHAFAIAGNHALFAGSYKDRDALHLLHLGKDGKATQLARLELQDAHGKAIQLERTVGRAEYLHVLSNRVLYTVSLWDVLAQHHPQPA